ncbi:MAG: hypothetical protein QOH97_3483 [Actinoplanes sp.]|nr:hypothetical protein [Actinoplanes sp.]
MPHQARYLATRWQYNDDDVDRYVVARHTISANPVGSREITLLARRPRSQWDPGHDEVGHMDYRICDRCRLGVVFKIRTSEEWKRRRYAAWMIKRSRRLAPRYTWVTSRQMSDARAFWDFVMAAVPGQRCSPAAAPGSPCTPPPSANNSAPSESPLCTPAPPRSASSSCRHHRQWSPGCSATTSCTPKPSPSKPVEAGRNTPPATTPGHNPRSRDRELRLLDHRRRPVLAPVLGLPPSRSFPEKRTSVLNEATDRNGYDVTSCRKRLGQGKADVNEGRPA